MGLGTPGVAEPIITGEVVRLAPGVGVGRGEGLGLLRGEKTLNDDEVTLGVPMPWEPVTLGVPMPWEPVTLGVPMPWEPVMLGVPMPWEPVTLAERDDMVR